MQQDFYWNLDLPKANLLNTPISKETFLTFGKLSVSGKQNFEKIFRSAKIKYSFKAEDLNYDTVTYKTMPYNELQIIEIKVNYSKAMFFELLRFASDIIQGIPYPTILVLNSNFSYKIFTSLVHENSKYSDKTVAENIVCSGWINFQKRQLKGFDIDTFLKIKNAFKDSKTILELLKSMIIICNEHNESCKVLYEKKKAKSKQFVNYESRINREFEYSEAIRKIKKRYKD